MFMKWVCISEDAGAIPRWTTALVAFSKLLNLKSFKISRCFVHEECNICSSIYLDKQSTKRLKEKCKYN